MAEEKKSLNVPPLRFPGFTDEWKLLNIGAITTKVGSGITPRGGNSVYTKEGRPFIRSQNVGNGTLLLDDIAYIDEQTHQKQKATELKCHDVLLNITGASIGRCAVVNNTIVGGNVNQHVCIIRPIEGYDSGFISNFILSRQGQKQIDSFQAGGNRQGLNFEQIKTIHIAIPSNVEQKRISYLLTLLDERIATQNKIIEDLKKLRTAIIDSSYRIVEREVKIGDLIIQTSERNKADTTHTVLSVSNKYGFIEQSDQFEDRIVASSDTSNYKIVRQGDFAYNPARINVGSIARMKRQSIGIVSPMYITFRTVNDIVQEYLEFFFDTKKFQNAMRIRLEGSVRQCLTFEALGEISLPLPSIEDQIHIAKRIELITEKIQLEEVIGNRLVMQKKYFLGKMFI